MPKNASPFSSTCAVTSSMLGGTDQLCHLPVKIVSRKHEADIVSGERVRSLPRPAAVGGGPRARAQSRRSAVRSPSCVHRRIAMCSLIRDKTVSTFPLTLTHNLHTFTDIHLHYLQSLTFTYVSYIHSLSRIFTHNRTLHLQ